MKVSDKKNKSESFGEDETVYEAACKLESTILGSTGSTPSGPYAFLVLSSEIEKSKPYEKLHCWA